MWSDLVICYYLGDVLNALKVIFGKKKPKMDHKSSPKWINVITWHTDLNWVILAKVSGHTTDKRDTLDFLARHIIAVQFLEIL